MSEPRPPHVFDAGPLSHFAEAGWLGLLREVVGAAPAWIPATVHTEISGGVDRHSHLRAVLDANWLRVRSAQSAVELAALGKYTARMLGDDQRTNLGECEVLALAEAHGGVAVLDDGVARKVASENSIAVKTTVAVLWILSARGTSVWISRQ